jgi:hypothetical protein
MSREILGIISFGGTSCGGDLPDENREKEKNESRDEGLGMRDE